MSLTVHMCQEASSTYRLVTSFRINWNFLNLPSFSLTNRAITRFPRAQNTRLTSFPPYEHGAESQFVYTTEQDRLQYVFTSHTDQFRFIYCQSHSVRIQFIHSSCYVSISIIKFVSLSFRLFCLYNSFSSSSFWRLNRTTRHSVDLTHIPFYAS
jgi:hypothetical protein